MSSWLSRGLSAAAGWLDTTVGTTMFSSGLTKATGFVSSVASSSIGQFAGDVVGEFVGDTYFGKSTGQQGQGFAMPTPGTMSPNFNSGVRDRSFSAGKTSSKFPGANSARIRNAYDQIKNSKQAEIRMAVSSPVKATIGRRGQTIRNQPPVIG